MVRLLVCLPGKRHEFVLGRYETVVSVEMFASNMVGKIRFFTNRGRVSPWYGHVEVRSFMLLHSWHADHSVGFAPALACRMGVVS